MADKDMGFRFYEKELPDIDELVHVQVKQVTDACAYVVLTEYGGKEAMILLGELSKKRIRSIHKEIRVGQFDVMMCLKVDEKGGVELSKSRVAIEDKKEFVERYAHSKMVQAVLKQVAGHNDDIALQELCEKISWPLYKEFGHPITVFKQYVNNMDDEWIKKCDVSEKIRKDILDEITRRLSPQAARLKAQIEVRCADFEGVNAVKKALIAGEAAANTDPNQNPVKVKVVSAPLYEVVTTSMGIGPGKARIEKCLSAIEESILASKGTFSCRSKPEMVEEADEAAKKDEDESSDDDEEASDDDAMPDIEHPDA